MPNQEFIIFGVSGLIVLGIGDSVACILGKEYGHSRWSEYSNKSQEGTMFLVVFSLTSYYAIITLLYPFS